MTYEAAITFVDVWRTVAIIATAIVCGLLPVAVGVTERPNRVWALLISIEAFAFANLVSMGRHVGEDELVWYRTPVSTIAAIAGLIPAFEDVVPWITLQINVLILSDGLPPDGEAWGQLIVSLGLWIVLPLGVGLWRIVNAEVK